MLQMGDGGREREGRKERDLRESDKIWSEYGRQRDRRVGFSGGSGIESLRFRFRFRTEEIGLRRKKSKTFPTCS